MCVCLAGRSKDARRIVKKSMLSFVKQFVSFLVCCACLAASDTKRNIIDVKVEHFSSHDKSTAEVLNDLALQIHVPIGISGFVVFNPEDRNRKTSIDADAKPLREILQEICSKDPAYSWRLFGDHSIDVRLRPRALSLIGISIAKLQINGATSAEALVGLLSLPQVQKWRDRTGCQAGHQVIINGQPPPDSNWRANVKVHDVPLWKILNELSIDSETYFWSAVGSSNPCYVFVDIMNGK